MTHQLRDRRAERGQAIVVLAVSVAVLLAMVAVVLDGGNAMAQQRGTQNAADAASLAGTTALMEHYYNGSKADADIYSAVTSSLSKNAADLETAEYVRFDGTVVGTVGGGSIPLGAQGVKVRATRGFSTFLAGVAGFPGMTAGGEATAMTGPPTSVAGLIPVTFSIPIISCDGTNNPMEIGDEWPIVTLEEAQADYQSGAFQHLSIVPLCVTGPGGVGWLDLCPEKNIQLHEQIAGGCGEITFDLPVWIHTSSGNTNDIKVENALNALQFAVVYVPQFDGTCREVPASGLPQDCTDPGVGNQTWYHIPQFAAFMLYEAHTNGNDTVPCNSPPGDPVDGNGATSCFKGWFLKYIPAAEIGELIGYTPGETLAVQLVR